MAELNFPRPTLTQNARYLCHTCNVEMTPECLPGYEWGNEIRAFLNCRPFMDYAKAIRASADGLGVDIKVSRYLDSREAGFNLGAGFAFIGAHFGGAKFSRMVCEDCGRVLLCDDITRALYTCNPDGSLRETGVTVS